MKYNGMLISAVESMSEATVAAGQHPPQSRIFRELQNIQFGENRTKEEAKAQPRSAAKQTNKASDQPPRPRPLRKQHPEDEIGRYKHVQLVDVDFNFVQFGKGQQLVNQTLLLGPHELRDSEHLAEELANVYGLSEQDSLTLSRMTISSFLSTPDTGQQQEGSVKVGENLKLSDRLSHLNDKGKATVSDIPQFINKKGDSKASALARHFELLSREFEKERIRDRKKRSAGMRQPRAMPPTTAAANAIVEVYNDIDEASAGPNTSLLASNEEGAASDVEASLPE
ncbi:uncharacterized protein J7T54_006691 [Emericellopsis cladophorae]|uniref:Uncharacterized protein n=1 Tax=Emericellopsis cladophorae TaxID=2686198 RepID=A0A9P9Y7C0_9HYPO|nr:uncharacterized protein J7T54_006691 [Emericellopsis cladophorae]KAI6784645.1 hypothetical protein J7T54_006691 [Emericellopsis cladophorae]